jgi:hypothetical protein
MGGLLPLLLLGLAAFGLVRNKSLWPLAVLGAVLIAVSAGVADSGCGYCVQRSVLPLGPLSGFAVAAGVTAIAATRFRGSQILAGVLLAGVVVVVWHTNTTLIRRAALGAYLMPKSVTSLLGGIDSAQDPVLIEGFAASTDAPGEFPAALLAAGGGGYRPHGKRLSVLAETNDYEGMAYLGPPRPAGPEFAPDYRTVVTRLGSIRTARRVVAT